MSDAPAHRRFEEIDVFRGIAALWVVYYHYVFRYRIMLSRPEKPWGWFAVNGIPEVTLGILPVAWFFIISGFVIVWTLERSRDWRDFAVSRFSRLYPTFWAAMTITLLLGLAAPLPGQHYTAVQVLANLTMNPGLFDQEPIDGAYWSLAVELHFYLMAVLLLPLGLMRHVPRLALAWAAACAFTQALPVLTGHNVPWKLQLLLDLRFGHFFAAGIAFYQLWTGRGGRLAWLTIAFCAVAIGFRMQPKAALIALAFLGLFALAVTGRLRWLPSRPLLWLGRISYALYVVHQMVGYRIMLWAEQAGAPRELAILLAATVVLTLADAITRHVEQPAMRVLRARLRPAS